MQFVWTYECAMWRGPVYGCGTHADKFPKYFFHHGQESHIPKDLFCKFHGKIHLFRSITCFCFLFFLLLAIYNVYIMKKYEHKMRSVVRVCFVAAEHFDKVPLEWRHWLNLLFYVFIYWELGIGIDKPYEKGKVLNLKMMQHKWNKTFIMQWLKRGHQMRW